MSLYAEAFQSGSGTDSFIQACGAGYDTPSCKTYVDNLVPTYVNDQMERKDNSIGATLAFSQRVFDADKNATYAMIRSKDLLAAKDFASSYNEGVANRITHDTDLTRRQFEINEYHYHNKLDTLFFLQLLFISILLMAILVYANRRGYLSTQTTGLLTVVLGILLVIIGISRYFYTTRTRDRRLWNRRYFPTEKPARPDLITTCPGAPAGAPSGVTINLQSLFTPDEIQCAEEASTAIDEWKNKMNKEAANYITGGTIPESIFKTADIKLPAKCKKN